MRIADNIIMFKLEAPYNQYTYPVLIWDENHLVLIDTGYPTQTEALQKAVVDAGFNVETLTEIIITHQDWDHLGGLSELTKVAPKAKILAHMDEVPYIEKQKTPIKLGAMLERYDTLTYEQKVACNVRKEMYDNLNVKVSQLLTEGEMIPICGGIDVIHTPGHTPGHIALFLEESGIMVAGDAVNHFDGQLESSNPVFTQDMTLANESFEKIKAIDMNGIISYHCGYLKLK